MRMYEKFNPEFCGPGTSGTHYRLVAPNSLVPNSRRYSNEETEKAEVRDRYTRKPGDQRNNSCISMKVVGVWKRMEGFTAP